MSACGNSSPNDNPLADGAPPNGKRFHRFLRTGHILSSILREILEEKFLHEVSPHTLNRAQFCLLKLIALNVDLQVGEVARWLGVSAAASSKNVDKLERLGLVARAATPTDRRATVLSTMLSTALSTSPMRSRAPAPSTTSPTLPPTTRP